MEKCLDKFQSVGVIKYFGRAKYFFNIFVLEVQVVATVLLYLHACTQLLKSESGLILGFLRGDFTFHSKWLLQWLSTRGFNHSNCVWETLGAKVAPHVTSMTCCIPRWTWLSWMSSHTTPPAVVKCGLSYSWNRNSLSTKPNNSFANENWLKPSKDSFGSLKLNKKAAPWMQWNNLVPGGSCQQFHKL